VLWILAVVIGALLLIAFVGVANCVLRGRTCPAPGMVREMLEDVVTAALGFAGGRLTANGK